MIRIPSFIVQSFLKSGLLFLFTLFFSTIMAQISHGGIPFPLSAGISARSVVPSSSFFVEMPSFDKETAVRGALESRTSFKSLKFAYKFDVHLRPDNSGVVFTYAGMEVWRVGIRSRGAHSINLLFSKFQLPEGAKLFVYNSDQSEILGSYTHENNSDLNMLPVQPIEGEEVIVEYQVPLHAENKGEIEIGDVNHDFLGIFRAKEPRDPENEGIWNCYLPDLVCYPENIEAGSGVVALIINGTTYCTGALVNNTAQNGIPYLLTATHCLNNDYDFQQNDPNNRWQNYGTKDSWKYDDVSGSIIGFFNYQSPLCGTNIRGPLQMTMASTDSVLISERHDISLLKFKQMPPAEFQPYYLGWNANSNAGSNQSGSFHGIHHPNGGIKKVAIEEDGLLLGSANLSSSKYNFEPNSFWIVRNWDVAITQPGSSGSPLLDKDKRIVGTLTGGRSDCDTSGPDIYASLYKLWEVDSSINNPNPIHYYLDPENLGTTQLNGYNPYENEPYTRSQNFGIDEKAVVTYHQSVPLFGTNNTFGYTEFAEEFQAKENLSLQGVFLSSPAINSFQNMNIRIRVYTGKNGPERLIYELPYNYNFRYYSNQSFYETGRDMRHSLENYIKFSYPVPVSNSFYISYLDAGGVPGGFSIFNAEPRKIGSDKISTAWMKNSTGWVRSSENIENPINTSFLIVPYVVGEGNVIVEPDIIDTDLKVYYSKEVQRVFIESNIDLLEWEIFYTSGIKIHQESADVSINRTSYPASHLPKGVYIVRVRTVDGKEATKKVLVI